MTKNTGNAEILATVRPEHLKEKRVVVYTRVSSTTDDSLQVDEGIKTAQRLGYDLNEIHIERDTGIGLGARAGLAKLMELVETEKIEQVIVWDLDRLSRDSSQSLNVTRHLENYGVKLHYNSHR